MGADEDVGVAGLEGVEDFFEGAAARGDVGVDAEGAGLGEEIVDFFFDALRAQAKLFDEGALAGGADFPGGGAECAVVADEVSGGAVLGVLVEDEGDAAVAAADDVAAGTAEDMAGVAAAVDQQDDLFLLCEAVGDGVFQRSRENAFVAHREFLAHVDQGGFGERLFEDALGEFDVAAGFGAFFVRGDVGGGAAEEHHGAFAFGAFDGN